MFRGSSFHTIDGKGRIIVPARFRELIRDGERPGVMISKLDKSLVAYPIKEWVKIENKILSRAEKSDSMRRFRRVFIGGASECFCDRQDRILIPPILRDYAGFDSWRVGNDQHDGTDQEHHPEHLEEEGSGFCRSWHDVIAPLV